MPHGDIVATIAERLFPPIPRPGDASFAEHARAVSERHFLSLGLFLVVASVAMWPLEPVLHRDPTVLHYLGWYRRAFLVMGALGFGTFAALPNSLATARRVVVLCIALLLALVTGVVSSQMGGLDEPFFYAGYLIPFCTVPLPMTLRGRASVIALQSAVFVVSFFGTHPEHLAHPNRANPFLLLFLAAALSTFGGNLLFSLLQRAYTQERRVARKALQLERRVRERTSQLSALAAHLETSREEERARVARELHDELGAYLTALRLEADLLADAHEGERIGTLVSEVMMRTKALVSELRPPVLDEFGTVAAIEWYVKQLGTRSGIVFEVVGDRAIEIQDESEAAVFRIVQEALTNVVKHARAQHVEVSFRQTAAAVEVRVTDDGVGFDPHASPAGGYGLLGMRERAHAIGADLSIERGARRGMRVTVRLPVTRRHTEKGATAA